MNLNTTRPNPLASIVVLAQLVIETVHSTVCNAVSHKDIRGEWVGTKDRATQVIQPPKTVIKQRYAHLAANCPFGVI